MFREDFIDVRVFEARFKMALFTEQNPIGKRF